MGKQPAITARKMNEREPELIDYLAVLWRWKWLVVGGTLAGLLVAGLVTWQQPRIYRVVAVMETGDVSELEAEEDPETGPQIT